MKCRNMIGIVLFPIQKQLLKAKVFQRKIQYLLTQVQNSYKTPPPLRHHRCHRTIGPPDNTVAQIVYACLCGQSGPVVNIVWPELENIGSW